MAHICQNLEEVRHHIDALDSQLITLIAQRGNYVAQAAGFKKNAEEVPAPQRVEQVISRVTTQATKLGADSIVVEAIWRAMIGAFINSELNTHAELAAEHAASAPPTH